MKSKAERWVTFDCFGTLVDWHAGFSAVLTPLAGERTPYLLRAYHEFERALEGERPHRLYREVLVQALLLASEKSGMRLTEDQARRLPQAWGSLPIFEDVEAMLAGLRALGCRLGVLTNCDEALFEQTQRGFRERFDLVVTAERVRDYKPSPAHFRFFSRSTGVDHREWVHVACSWYHDIAPAKAFGIRSIWLDREATGEDPAVASARVPSAREVCAAVEELYAGVSPEV